MNPSKPTRLIDYQASAFLIPKTDLHFRLDPENTAVCAQLEIAPNPDAPKRPDSLTLNAERIEIDELLIDGETLDAGRWRQEGAHLIIDGFPAAGALLSTRHRIQPSKNRDLSGLYVSDGILCTQCEPEGFRRICPFLDRPDVLSQFTVHITADPARYPTLLSNGNSIAQRQCEDGMIEAIWEDPHPKPSYLFALVAGELECRETTHRPRHREPGVPEEVTVAIYACAKNIERVEYALGSAVRAMRWDEEAFNRSYDLARYMIVAIDDFNSGAMENKGLNIFNSSYLLADASTATDADYITIDAVVAHEYFHNWTGNRVTCRDWFQLSLKEGLTVARENLYMHQAHSSAMRIQGIRALQTSQFNEDAGPTAHPVQPDSYHEIGNFYTTTIYEKGAEIIGMLRQMIGEKDFAKGMDAYFERYDGQAVTIQDLIATLLSHSRFKDNACINCASIDLWYKQKGTPQLLADFHYDEPSRSLIIDLRQKRPACYGANDQWRPVPVPIALSVLDAEGNTHAPRIEDDNYNAAARSYVLSEESAQLRLRDVEKGSLPSLLENFSAPVILRSPYTRPQLQHLALHCQDPYTRWQSIQFLALQEMSPNHLSGSGSEREAGDDVVLPAVFRRICQETVDHLATAKSIDGYDYALVSEYLKLPSESYLLNKYTPSDPIANRLRRRWCLRMIHEECAPLIEELYRRSYQALAGSHGHATETGLRALANTCLGLMSQCEREEDLPLDELRAQFHHGNLTLRIGALNAVNLTTDPLRDELFASFRDTIGDKLMLKEKYLRMLAGARIGATDKVRQLLEGHDTDEFDIRNPNQAYSLMFGYCSHNLAALHAYDGSGYRLVADCVKRIDSFNPSVSSRIAKAFDSCQFLVGPLRTHIAEALDDISAIELSPALREIISKTRSSLA